MRGVLVDLLERVNRHLLEVAIDAALMRGVGRGARAVAMIAAVASVVVCVGGRTVVNEEPDDRDMAGATPMTQQTIEEVLAGHTEEWMSVPGVVGTGVGACDGEPCIKVFVARLTDELSQTLPNQVEGFVVRLEVTGAFQARGRIPSSLPLRLDPSIPRSLDPFSSPPPLLLPS